MDMNFDGLNGFHRDSLTCRWPTHYPQGAPICKTWWKMGPNMWFLSILGHFGPLGRVRRAKNAWIGLHWAQSFYQLARLGLDSSPMGLTHFDPSGSNTPPARPLCYHTGLKGGVRWGLRKKCSGLVFFTSILGYLWKISSIYWGW